MLAGFSLQSLQRMPWNEKPLPIKVRLYRIFPDAKPIFLKNCLDFFA